MRAILATTFRCGCLLLAVGAAALWVRSHYVSDTFRWNVARPPRPASTAASVSAPASASTPVSGSNVTASLFLLLKSQDFANPYRSVKTVPGRLVIQQHPPFEIFL